MMQLSPCPSTKALEITLALMSFGSPAWKPWVIDAEAGRELISFALNRGILAFDTADFYSEGESEEIIGAFLNRSAIREELFISTKVGYRTTPDDSAGLAKARVIRSIEASLRRLRTDRIELYYVHGWDPKTPVEETARTLNGLVASGKVRFVGLSNLSMDQIAQFERYLDVPPYALQLQYNAIYRGEECVGLAYCQNGLCRGYAYSPLARGRLAADSSFDTAIERTRQQTDEKAELLYGSVINGKVISAIRHIARQRQLSPAVIAFAWLRSRPGVHGAVSGAMTKAHLNAALEGAVTQLSKSEEDLIDLAYIRVPLEHVDLYGDRTSIYNHLM